MRKGQDITRTVQEVMAADSRVEFAYLYGSYAGGRMLGILTLLSTRALELCITSLQLI